MQPIKVRGYAVEQYTSSQWQYGTGVHVIEFTDEYAKEIGRKEDCFIFTESGWVEVFKESVGQYTGLVDSNNKEIYHRDIVTLGGEEPYSNHNFTTEYDWEFTGEVIYLYGAFWVNDNGMMVSLTDYFNSDDMRAAVIGNKYENRQEGCD